MNEKCTITVIGVGRCDQPASYTFRIEGCGFCLTFGSNTCTAHDACAEHMALLRDDTYALSSPGTLFHRSDVRPDSIVGIRNRATP